MIKWNNGNLAILCNHCSIIIWYGDENKHKEHICSECKKLGRLAESGNAPVLKTESVVSSRYEGSNPSPSATI